MVSIEQTSKEGFTISGDCESLVNFGELVALMGKMGDNASVTYYDSHKPDIKIDIESAPKVRGGIPGTINHIKTSESNTINCRCVDRVEA